MCLLLMSVINPEKMNYSTHLKHCVREFYVCVRVCVCVCVCRCVGVTERKREREREGGRGETEFNIDYTRIS